VEPVGPHPAYEVFGVTVPFDRAECRELCDCRHLVERSARDCAMETPVREVFEPVGHSAGSRRTLRLTIATRGHAVKDSQLKSLACSHSG
jgi:hypothetical protein